MCHDRAPHNHQCGRLSLMPNAQKCVGYSVYVTLSVNVLQHWLVASRHFAWASGFAAECSNIQELILNLNRLDVLKVNMWLKYS